MCSESYALGLCVCVCVCLLFVYLSLCYHASSSGVLQHAWNGMGRELREL